MTISRRALLRHGAGVVVGITLAGCIVLDTARRQSVADPIAAPETYSAPGPMLIDAERVRTVDIHAHCDVSEGLALLGAAHGGGFLPSSAARGDRSCFVSPQNCDATVVLKKKPSEYASQIRFDALVFTPEALRYLVAQVGVRQVVLGTDHPIPWEDHPVDHVLNTPSLSAADRVAILGDDARRLLNLAA